jgi:hypothetical protein
VNATAIPNPRFSCKPIHTDIAIKTDRLSVAIYHSRVRSVRGHTENRKTTWRGGEERRKRKGKKEQPRDYASRAAAARINSSDTQ